MDAEFERLSLPLSTPFTISRGTTETAENVLVRVRHDGHEGVGAAAPSRRYGETADTVEAVLPDLLDAVEDADPYQVADVERRLESVARRNPAARTAVSIAVHDLVGKLLDVPLYRYLGLDPSQAVPTSYTIGIDDTDRMVDRASAAADAGYHELKVKLGTDPDRDLSIVRRIREACPDVGLRVDANEAWTPKEAVRKCRALADHDVTFVEQPLPAEYHSGLAQVHDRSPLPIAVDESVERAADVPGIADRADIATFKLMKAGGVHETVRAIHAARAHGLEVMIGCMVESSAAIAASAHLTPLVDHADLDGSLLLAEDPFEGPVQGGGAIDLEERPGTGARES